MTPHVTNNECGFQEHITSSFGADGRLAIIGATGWIGSVLARMAIRAGLTPENGRLKLYGSMPRTLSVDASTSVPVDALSHADQLIGENWIVAHFAYLGNEWTRALEPAEYARRTDVIMHDFYRLVQNAVCPKVVFSSSGAVYKENRQPVNSLEESPYGFMKLKHEASAIDAVERQGGTVIVPRIFNIGGPLGNKQSLYAMASMIIDALNGRDLVIRASGPVFRSYVDVEELVTLLLAQIAVPLQDLPQRFDTAGVEVVEMADLARAVLVAVGRPETRIVRHFDPVAESNWYVGDGMSYQIALRRKGLQPKTLGEIIRRSIPQR